VTATVKAALTETQLPLGAVPGVTECVY
jgi:hypothetical protein